MYESTKNVVKADLHLHTVYSDGLSRPEDYILTAIKQGFKIISITDHDTFLGSKHAIEFVKSRVRQLSYKITIVPGAEIRTNIGDVLVYCISYVSDTAPKDIQELLDWCRDNNCIPVPAHPLDFTRSGIGLWNLVRYPWPAVETYNGGCVIPLMNELTSSLVRLVGLPEIGGSDAHHVDAFGTCMTYIPEEYADSPEFVVEAIVKGHVKPAQRASYVKRLKLKINIRSLRKMLKRKTI